MLSERLILAFRLDSDGYEYSLGRPEGLPGGPWEMYLDTYNWMAGACGDSTTSLYRRQKVKKRAKAPEKKDVRIRLYPGSTLDAPALTFMYREKNAMFPYPQPMICPGFMKRHWPKAMRGGTLVISDKKLPGSVRIVGAAMRGDTLDITDPDGDVTLLVNGDRVKTRASWYMTDELIKFGTPCYVTVEPNEGQASYIPQCSWVGDRHLQLK